MYPARQDPGPHSKQVDGSTAVARSRPTTTGTRGVYLIPLPAQRMNTHEVPFCFFPCEQYHAGVSTWLEKFWATTNAPVSSKRTRICPQGLSLKQELSVKNLWPDTWRMVSHMRLIVHFVTPVPISQSASPSQLRIEKLEDALHLCGKLWPQNSRRFSLNEMLKIFSLSLHLMYVHKSSAFWMAGTERESQFLNLHYSDTNIRLILLLLTCAFLAFLTMYCDKSFVKPAIRLRIAGPMCDGLPSTPSPFRRLGSRGHPFRGSPCWWAMQFVIYLARCLTLHDPVPRYREGSQYHYSCSHDTLSCLFYTALWLGQCQTILTQTQQSDDIDMACCRILPIDPITCSHVGPRSLARLAASPGGFDQSCLSTSWKDFNIWTPGKCSPRSPHTCVGGEMLFNRLEYNKSGGMGTRAFPFLTALFDGFLGIREDLLDPRFLRNLPAKESTTQRTQNKDIVCLQDTRGKDEFLQAIQVLAPRFRLHGTFTPDNVNEGGSAFCIHKDLHVVTCPLWSSMSISS